MGNEEMRLLARRIKVLRAERDMTQEELAEKSGMSLSAISLIENCKKEPRMATLVKIANVLSVDADELLRFVK